MSEPMTRLARGAKRRKLLEDAIEQAKVTGAARNRSMKCSGDGIPYQQPRHASELDGCKNDGSGCLCECHDPVTS